MRIQPRQAIPVSRCELQLLAERGVRQFARGHTQRLSAFVPYGLVERHIGLRPIHVETPLFVHLSQTRNPAFAGCRWRIRHPGADRAAARSEAQKMPLIIGV